MDSGVKLQHLGSLLHCNNIFAALLTSKSTERHPSVFKPGTALATGWHTLGFLKLFLCGHLYVCLCVSAPEAINN